MADPVHSSSIGLPETQSGPSQPSHVATSSQSHEFPTSTSEVGDEDTGESSAAGELIALQPNDP